MEGKYFGEVCCCGDDISSVLETDGAEEADGLASQPRGICGCYGPAVRQAEEMGRSGCMERAGPMEAHTGTMNLRAEYDYLLRFAEGSCFHDSHTQDQLRALWTAFCFHAGWEADTEPYDSTMMELWKRGGGRPDGWPDFRSFDDYMCEFLA